MTFIVPVATVLIGVLSGGLSGPPPVANPMSPTGSLACFTPRRHRARQRGASEANTTLSRYFAGLSVLYMVAKIFQLPSFPRRYKSKYLPVTLAVPLPDG